MPSDQRRGTAGGHDRARLVGVGEDQGEVTLEPAQHRQHRGREVAGVVAHVVLPRDQVDSDLGVGVAGELHPGGLELSTQRGEVLDDAVVDHRDLAGGVAVRVGVAIGGPAVGGPPGVPERGRTDETLGTRLAERGLQVGQTSGLAAYREAAVTVEQRHAGRVVAPVLHAAQRVDDDAAGRTLPDIADDSAHSPPG